MIRNMKKLFDLSGKAAVITGAGSGLGQGIAEGYAQLGAGVSVVDVNLEAAQRVADGIKTEGGKAISVPCDVTQPDQVQAAVAQTLEEFGKIDILVANAGIGDRNPAEEMTDQQWERVMDINLTGVWLFNQAVGKGNRRRHEYVSFVAGIAKHQALIPGTLFVIFGLIHAHGDIGRLLVD